MVRNLMIRVRTAFGLACDVEKTGEQRSGFKPAEVDLSAGKKLFGGLRLKGFAAALECGFAEKLVVVGGIETRYPGEEISRAGAIRRILLEDFGIAPDRVEALQSAPNTAGNIAAIKWVLQERNLPAKDCGLVSNHYHLPRVQTDLWAYELPVPAFPAETFWLLGCDTFEEREARKKQLIVCFGGTLLADRLAEEVSGIADKLRGASGGLAVVPRG